MEDSFKEFIQNIVGREKDIKKYKIEGKSMEDRVEIFNKQLINVLEEENSENDGRVIFEKVIVEKCLEDYVYIE